MQIKNQDIRDSILKNNLKYWMVAAAYGMTDGNFSRLLRRELTKEEKEKILKIIEILKEEN